MDININFNTDNEFTLKPYVWKQFFHNVYDQKYYDCTIYVSIMWLWFEFEITIPYKGEK